MARGLTSAVKTELATGNVRPVNLIYIGFPTPVYLTTASFDFSQSNNESSTSLNEVKLMVDSKLSKQYPNLDFFKLCNT